MTMFLCFESNRIMFGYTAKTKSNEGNFSIIICGITLICTKYAGIETFGLVTILFIKQMSHVHQNWSPIRSGLDGHETQHTSAHTHACPTGMWRIRSVDNAQVWAWACVIVWSLSDDPLIKVQYFNKTINIPIFNIKYNYIIEWKMRPGIPSVIIYT